MKFTRNFLVLIFGLLMQVNIANAESPREQLKQMVEQLQKSADDNALRENIIHLAQTLKPVLAIPEEARRSFVRGNTAFSEAKNQDDYARAVQRYEEALMIAPWWGDPYFNLAKAQEMRQEYSRAIQSLKFFVLTGPTADDARKAQDYSYALEDKQERVTREKAIQESEARADEARYGWLLGRWRVHSCSKYNCFPDEQVFATKKNNNNIIFEPIVDPSRAQLRAYIQSGGEIKWEAYTSLVIGESPQWNSIEPTVSADKQTINYNLLEAGFTVSVYRP